MRAYRLIYLVLLFVSFSTYASLHAQEGITCPGFQPSRLTIGGQGQVTPGSSNNLRSSPTRTADKTGEIPGGGRFTVLDGPICADDTAWWQVDYQGLSGWTVEGMDNEYWLEIVLGEIPEWTTFDVIGGPHCDDGEVWVEADYNGLRGWFVEVALSRCDSYCNGEPYLNARLPLLPLQTVVPAQDNNPLSMRPAINLSPNAITATTATQVTTLQILGEGYVRDYAWSPDTSQLVVAGTMEIRIYETRQLSVPLRVLTGFTGLVSQVLFSPDGRLLVTAYMDGNIQLRDTETYDILYTLDHGEPTFEAVLSPDGSLLAVGGRKGISLWEIDGLEEPQLRHQIEMKNETRWLGSLIFVPGKDELLDVQSQNIYLHNLVTGETRQLLEELSMCCSFAAWAMSPNGAHVTTILEEAIGDTHIAFWYFGSTWDIETGERVPLPSDRLLQSDGMQITIPELKYDPDGSSLLLTTSDQQELQPYLRDIYRLFDLKGVTDAEYSPDGSLLAFTLSTGEIRLYRGTQSVNVLYGISGAAYRPDFSPDGRYLAAAGSDGTLRVWNIETNQRLGTVSFLGFPSEFWLNTDQTTLISGVRTWDIASGERGAAFSLPEGYSLLQTRDDGRVILKSENSIVVYDPELAQPVLEVPVDTSYFGLPTVSADGRWLVYSDGNNFEPSLSTVKVINLSDGTLIQTFQRQFEKPWGLYLSPDGGLLIVFDRGPVTSEGRDYRLLVWEVSTGNLLQVISTGNEGISDAELIFSPDGTRIAWRVESGLAIYDLLSQTMTTTEGVEEFDKFAAAFSFNADGSAIALGDLTGDIHLFDTSTGEKVATLDGHISPVRKLVFSRDGRRLYSTAGEGLLRIWGVP